MVRKRKQPETDGKGEPQSQVKKGVSAKAAAKVADSLVSSKYTGPFPDRERPTSQECTDAREGLARLHGEPVKADINEEKVKIEGQAATKPAQRTVLDSLARTILSQNTTDTTSNRAFTSLKAAFPTWEDVRHAPAGGVEESIRVGGLAEIKTQRLKAILNTLVEERGEADMEYLRDMNDEDVKNDLMRFKGVGKKTVACVLMFCLHRHEFPVDTHVWRIAKRLGWVPKKASRDETYEHLNMRVPDDIKYDLHVLLVEHGKKCIRCSPDGHPRKPVEGPCPLQYPTSTKQGSDAEASSEDDEHAADPPPDSSPIGKKSGKAGSKKGKAAAEPTKDAAKSKKPASRRVAERASKRPKTDAQPGAESIKREEEDASADGTADAPADQNVGVKTEIKTEVKDEADGQAAGLSGHAQHQQTEKHGEPSGSSQVKQESGKALDDQQQNIDASLEQPPAAAAGRRSQRHKQQRNDVVKQEQA